jgi:methyl-accepting chemotaxis protein
MLAYFVRALQKLNWPLRNKLGIAFALLMVWFLISGLISSYLLLGIKSAVEHQSRNSVNLERTQRYSLAYNSIIDIYYDTIFITHNTFIRNNFQTLILDALKERNRNDPDTGNREFEEQFAKLYTKAFDHFFILDSYIRADNFNQAEKDWQQFEADFEAVKSLLVAREKTLQASQLSLQNEVGQTVSLFLTILALMTAFSLLIIVFVLVLISRVIIKPLNQLTGALQQMSQGHLNQELLITNQDEIGELALNFRASLTKLDQIIKGVHISGQLEAVTNQLTVVSHEQTVISNQQVSALTQVLSSMEELDQTASHIANTVMQMNSLTETTVQQIGVVSHTSQVTKHSTTEMSQVIAQSIAGIEQIERQVTTVHEKADVLVAQTASIGKVVELLASVAGEVHLLALNAAIEAASSGTYGSRFKEVAREIRDLAKRANTATLEARKIIEVVQLSSRDVLTEVVGSHAQIKQLSTGNNYLHSAVYELKENTSQVSESVEQLLKLADLLGQRAGEIKEATTQQKIASGQVITSAQSVELSARHTASASYQTADSSLQLQTLAQQLNNVLNHVHLKVESAR